MLNSPEIQVRFPKVEVKFEHDNVLDNMRCRKRVAEDSARIIRGIHQSWDMMSIEERIVSRQLVASAWERLCNAAYTEEFYKYILDCEIKRTKKDPNLIGRPKWFHKIDEAANDAEYIVCRADVDWERKMSFLNKYGKEVETYTRELFEENSVLYNSIDGVTCPTYC